MPNPVAAQHPAKVVGKKKRFVPYIGRLPIENKVIVVKNGYYLINVRKIIGLAKSGKLAPVDEEEEAKIIKSLSKACGTLKDDAATKLQDLSEQVKTQQKKLALLKLKKEAKIAAKTAIPPSTSNTGGVIVAKAATTVAAATNQAIIAAGTAMVNGHTAVAVEILNDVTRHQRNAFGMDSD